MSVSEAQKKATAKLVLAMEADITMLKYQIIIFWSEEDECFLAKVPELAGCMADGRTARQALENVEIVMKEWIETAKELGREIPEPEGQFLYA